MYLVKMVKLFIVAYLNLFTQIFLKSLDICLKDSNSLQQVNVCHVLLYAYLCID